MLDPEGAQRAMKMVDPAMWVLYVAGKKMNDAFEKQVLVMIL